MKKSGHVMVAAALLPLAAVFFCGSCAGPDAYLVAPGFAVEGAGRVAVLPFDNHSTDISAPELLRKEVHKRLGRHGYALLDLSGTDDKLRELGITDGGQLPSMKPGDLGAALGAELLCYGSLEDFTFQNLGFVIRKSVRLRIKIVSAATGEPLFEAAGSGRDVKVFLNKDEAAGAFLLYTAQKLAENLMHHPLRAESEKAVGRVFERLPRR